MKVKDLVYMILDECKLSSSDDLFITEDHVIFLIKKYRSFLIKKEQEREKTSTDVASEFEYQQICLDLEKIEAIPGYPCEGGYYLRSVQPVPKVLEGTVPRVYSIDFYGSINMAFVSREKMKFVGTNRFLKNIIYASIGPDLHLYIKADDPQFSYLRCLRMSAIFEDFDEASSLLCDADGNDESCDALEAEFPIRDYLVPTLIEMTVKELVGASYRPNDKENNANDDLADIMAFIRRNMKSGLQRQIEND